MVTSFDEVAGGKKKKKWLRTRNTYVICTLSLCLTHKHTLQTRLQSPPLFFFFFSPPPQRYICHSAQLYVCFTLVFLPLSPSLCCFRTSLWLLLQDISNPPSHTFTAFQVPSRATAWSPSPPSPPPPFHFPLCFLSLPSPPPFSHHISLSLISPHLPLCDW